MGILDDAIREHLELKRQHGAAADDLDKLEQEAFGPVARPGDPEFETGEEQAEAEAEPPRPGDDDWSLGEDPTSIAPVESDAPAADEPESVEQPVPEPPESAIFDVDLDEEATPAERARVEHSDLEDTVDHPAPRVESLEEELENAAPTPAEVDSGELETFMAPPADEPGPGDPEVPASTEEPESIEFDELPGETVEANTGEHGGDDESDEDLLEETPDFLKDAPDGEDLWFEAGKPKDFDFDD